MSKAITIFSGGMDSFTLLHWARRYHEEVAALSFNYGQRHAKELDYAVAEAGRLGIRHELVQLANIQHLLAGSALTSDIAVPEGHYAQDNMRLTVVPNRNMIMLSIAVGYAVSTGADMVYFGAHAGDHDVYPDCRPGFVKKLNAVAEVANYAAVNVRAPFLELTKAGILKQGARLGLGARDYERTWTCYKGEARPCGVCGSCTERLEAFAELGWNDPLDYVDREAYKAVLAAGPQA